MVFKCSYTRFVYFSVNLEIEVGYLKELTTSMYYVPIVVARKQSFVTSIKKTVFTRCAFQTFGRPDRFGSTENFCNLSNFAKVFYF